MAKVNKGRPASRRAQLMSTGGYRQGALDTSVEADVGRQIVPQSTGCWFHSSGRDYPQVRISRQRINVVLHRWMYEQLVGPIPAGHHLHHTCFDPRCVNPAHLEPLTPADHQAAHRSA